MADRLTSITTGTGDDGTTGIVGGDRLGKDDPRIEAIGCVDELNCFVGAALAELGNNDTGATEIEGQLHENSAASAALDSLANKLLAIQHDLFDLGGELAMPPEALLSEAHHQRLLEWQEAMNQTLEPLANFILPGGSKTLAALHVARSQTRRAERRLVTLSRATDVNPNSLVYLNRLSDFLFVASRWVASVSHTSEVLWQQNIHRNS